MQKSELLPGVSSDSCPPRVVCDAKAEIRRARVRAGLQSLLQVVLIALVDYLFVRWPESRLPFLDRESSLSLLRVGNLVIFGDLFLSRALPKWSAKRIAGTWCRSERERFGRVAQR